MIGGWSIRREISCVFMMNQTGGKAAGLVTSFHELT
jgi:hypothetical protein